MSTKEFTEHICDGCGEKVVIPAGTYGSTLKWWHVERTGHIGDGLDRTFDFCSLTCLRDWVLKKL